MNLPTPPPGMPAPALQALAVLCAGADKPGLTARVLDYLRSLPGVARAEVVPAGGTAPGASERAYAWTDGAAGPREIALVLGDAAAFAPCEPWLALFCQVLERLAQAQRLQTLADQLQRSEQRFRDLFNNSPDPCWIIENGAFTDCNLAAVQALGYARREDILQHPSRLSPEFQPDGRSSFDKAEEMMQRALRDGLARFEWEHCRADGRSLPVEVTLARLELQDHAVLYCVWRDITDRKQAEEEAYQLAFFDPLTGLPNRRLLHDRLQQSMAASARSGKYRALLYLDLDHFKNLNDTHGHAMGDRLLIEMAQRLRTCVREGDTVARLGGDEFVLLVQQLDEDLETAVAQAGRIGDKVVAQLSQPCAIGAVQYQGSASVGVSMFLGHALGTDELLKRADLAMYQAKAAGRNTVRFFDPAIQARLNARAALEADLRQAVQRNELVLHYQPQVDTQGRCLGVEALVRWEHPQRGQVQPLDFIPLAEETGLILPIGQWVLCQACSTMAAWEADPRLAGLGMAVNVSARQLHQPDFVHNVRVQLRSHGIDPALLKLEITESMLLDNIEQTVETMQALKALGVRFSLDDFGTGYSSLNYVKRLPLDQIKIDKSFVRDILSDPNDAAICRTVIAMGRSLGLSTLAEGVEQPAQWDFLAQEGCDAAQGYLYARPMALPDLQAWLGRQRL
ncbi:EAL domain-containing protein [Acidovorax sp. 210-6]|uniref:putative bifunctional diguanylate cyclase/phosphodiesterase n=1 Tax=Acidovorax sp. 210-6 TaxID=2699468 RepID=UPI00138A61C5|nr:EAL domain-containing protein [Acidovorax sp. 210-6]NCU67733.1 EAL domain-containing protein [Acidovorax sp. 210-6]